MRLSWAKGRRHGPSVALLVLACAASACNGPGAERPRPAVVLDEPAPGPAWRGILRASDLDRIDRLDSAWEEALAIARSAGFTRRVRAEGELLDPDAALPRAAPAPGSYRCRLIRIGAARRGRNAFRVTGPYFCFVGAEGALLSLTRQTGTVRPGGYLHEDEDDTRQIFIGAVARGRETTPPAYSDEPERDAAGIVERVDNFRYRLVIPWPEGAILEVYELVPAL